MPLVEPAQLAFHLARGAVGIGEAHDKPEGRAKAIELIKQEGLVTNLFVEFAETHYLDAMNKAWNARAQGTAAIMKFAPDGKVSNSIPLSMVIAKAMKRNIPVHCGDHVRMGSHPKEYQTRHTRIREVFRMVTNDTNAVTKTSAVGDHAIGCLLLWGSNHFGGDHALDKYIRGLPFAMF